MKYIKYKLLVWLLDDICKRSRCVSCRLGKLCGINSYYCHVGDIYAQAKTAWGLED